MVGSHLDKLETIGLWLGKVETFSSWLGEVEVVSAWSDNAGTVDKLQWSFITIANFGPSLIVRFNDPRPSVLLVHIVHYL